MNVLDSLRSFHFFKEPKQKYSLSATVKNTAMNTACTLLSVSAYHPFRTLATCLITKQAIDWSAKGLYRGFVPSALASHQLFMMTTADTYLTAYFFADKSELSNGERIAKALAAGACSTFTVTPVELATVCKQVQKTMPPPSWQWFRGFTPQMVRQGGLGLGFFVFPDWIKQHLMTDPQDNHLSTRMICHFTAGSLASVLTQIPEVARILMQKDLERAHYPTTRQALQAATHQVFSPQGAKALGARMTVLAICTLVLNMSREWMQHQTKENHHE